MIFDSLTIAGILSAAVAGGVFLALSARGVATRASRRR